MFVTDDNHSIDIPVINSETKRKRYYSDGNESDDEEDQFPEPEHEALLSQEQIHEQARLHHLHMQQPPPNYVAVLNDPAMKQKLRERNTRLQQV